jgi:hypothetical protein
MKPGSQTKTQVKYATDIIASKCRCLVIGQIRRDFPRQNATDSTGATGGTGSASGSSTIPAQADSGIWMTAFANPLRGGARCLAM